ncbi:MAG: Zn-ribbon domain-containing OB-fold protein [Caulobacteraceae bacterium]|nr:MAG: Zn-ribbon domain-containing OB-fold protein [Caulobacteraceae bacterium]
MQAEQGRFLIKRCTACNQPFWYPRALCPFCGSPETEWLESPGEGEIYSYSIMRRAPGGPYAMVFVTLDEGPTLLSNLVDCQPDQVRIGARVKLRWQDTEGGPPAPVFALA